MFKVFNSFWILKQGTRKRNFSDQKGWYKLWNHVFSGVMCQPSVYNWRSYPNRCLPRRAGYVQCFWILFWKKEKKWSFIWKLMLHGPFYWLSPRHSMEAQIPRKRTHIPALLPETGYMWACKSYVKIGRHQTVSWRKEVIMWIRKLVCFWPLKTEVGANLIMGALALRQKRGIRAHGRKSSSKDSGDKGHGSFLL